MALLTETEDFLREEIAAARNELIGLPVDARSGIRTSIDARLNEYARSFVIISHLMSGAT